MTSRRACGSSGHAPSQHHSGSRLEREAHQQLRVRLGDLPAQQGPARGHQLRAGRDDRDTRRLGDGEVGDARRRGGRGLQCADESPGRAAVRRRARASSARRRMWMPARRGAWVTATMSSESSSPPSVSSKGTMASAAEGTGEPVMMRAASPGPRGGSRSVPAGRSATTRRRTGASGRAVATSVEAHREAVHGGVVEDRDVHRRAQGRREGAPAGTADGDGLAGEGLHGGQDVGEVLLHRAEVVGHAGRSANAWRHASIPPVEHRGGHSRVGRAPRPHGGRGSPTWHTTTTGPAMAEGSASTAASGTWWAPGIGSSATSNASRTSSRAGGRRRGERLGEFAGARSTPPRGCRAGMTDAGWRCGSRRADVAVGRACVVGCRRPTRPEGHFALARRGASRARARGRGGARRCPR